MHRSIVFPSPEQVRRFSLIHPILPTKHACLGNERDLRDLPTASFEEAKTKKLRHVLTGLWH